MQIDSISTLDPLHAVMGDMPPNILKNDYFVDVNPRSMRRLRNIIAVAGMFHLVIFAEVCFLWYDIFMVKLPCWYLGLRLSMDHNDSISINGPPHIETCFCSKVESEELILTTGAHRDRCDCDRD